MLKFEKKILIILIFSVLFTFFNFTLNSYATNINMELGQQANVTDTENPGNNLQNSNTQLGITSLNTNTSATVQSVEQFEDNTSSFDFTNIINILLLAVGLVIILLAVAILIRLKR